MTKLLIDFLLKTFIPSYWRELQTLRAMRRARRTPAPSGPFYDPNYEFPYSQDDPFLQ